METKTWKREVAFVVLLWNVYLSIKYVEAFEIAITPSFLFITLAFGLDYFGKGGRQALAKANELVNPPSKEE